ncbi:hypothetical protein [Porphyromonas circumdentaria]|uniref:PH domain-containing protein n=1 Tax=Porphyromonas circumdentaria TaxID=29524 RepID=A0A1T4PDR9_9PORP|nr:hypothetical protein [Porphyromonas circumdentaria]MBB6276371.1 hypothetical protein [Porphyromonas circumdentaria]MDO4722866.1 hypothetical protein [Porphyromonas circumdentaria]SJZ88948.1 hypothetical protein SAMN02745171_01401 [Porphyromonas circumdentaria]
MNAKPQKETHKRYYLRRSIKNRQIAIVLACLYAIALGIFTVLIAIHTPAPWWTLIPPVGMIPVGIIYFFRQNTYYSIDHEAYLLMAGNDYGRKLHPVARLTELQEVRYLPYTQEVKIRKGDGTEYLKLQEGEEFVKSLEQLFEEIYPTGEGE